MKMFRGRDTVVIWISCCGVLYWTVYWEPKQRQSSSEIYYFFERKGYMRPARKNILQNLVLTFIKQVEICFIRNIHHVQFSRLNLFVDNFTSKILVVTYTTVILATQTKTTKIIIYITRIVNNLITITYSYLISIFTPGSRNIVNWLRLSREEQ